MSTSGYQEAIDYLYSFVDFSVKRSYRYSAEVFDLARVVELLALLGDPQTKFHSIHIAGTKGKGSVSALLESALRAAGYRTGLYTSPHLIDFTERIQVSGQQIPEPDVARLVERMKPEVARVPDLSTYELITALGFLHFADQEVEWAVVEVGLGGRLDATNVLRPDICAITSISYDHMHLLGESLSDIAAEKAGIIKPGTPVVMAPQQHEAGIVIESIAEEKGAPVIKVGHDWLFAAGSRDFDAQLFYVWPTQEQELMDAYVDSAGGDEWVPAKYEIPLLGYHQVINGAVAFATLQELKRQGHEIRNSAISDGFRTVQWLGRFQIISRNPIIVVDSAHNRDSALKLRIALDDYFPGRRVILIFGASADKDLRGMVDELSPRVSRMIATQSDHPRAESTEALAELGHQHGLQVEQVAPVSAALSRAISLAGPDDVVLATGSIFVAGDLLKSWQKIVQSEIEPSKDIIP
jgi:dihydrofolate synthase/folylpolyglutamate synthase